MGLNEEPAIAKHYICSPGLTLHISVIRELLKDPLDISLISYAALR